MRYALVWLIAFAATTTISQVHAVECNQYEWDQLLDSQLTAESRYNDYSKEFNLVLGTFKTHIFLSKQFSQQELISFWRQNNPFFQQQLDQQIKTTRQAYKILLKQAHLTQIEIEQIVQLKDNWAETAESCRAQNQDRQYKTAQNHVVHTQTLISDYVSLSDKFRNLALRYLSESNSILSAKQAALEDNVDMK
ncbi:hypothetical protein LZI70_17270 [Vibrio pelagius]|uniref:ATPase n=1 Tax=Vibrio pelagius TaxID=28169 RepID=A0ABY5G7H5_VIBPE|nr:hypothetical protein [Vibrio pelagius]UTT86118.1 hypothetical protein LZI70_17270 [Vibrio pelagius]